MTKSVPPKPLAFDPTKVMNFIARCAEPEKLRLLIRNAKVQKNEEIETAAFRRLISLAPQAKAGTVEHDFWQTIHAFEESLTEERGKTTRLVRTRQKVQRVGVLQTLRDWALDKKETEGFSMLVARGMPEMTGEAIVLRHPGHFDEVVRTAARIKLEKAGIEIAALPGG